MRTLTEAVVLGAFWGAASVPFAGWVNGGIVAVAIALGVAAKWLWER